LGGKTDFMMLADVPPVSVYFLSPLLILAFVATFIGFLTAFVLSFRKQTRRAASKVFRIAIYSVPVEIALLIFVLTLD